MKILLIHRFFWPDTPPYALMLKQIARQLSSEGHNVTVLSSQPSYKAEYKIPKQPWQEKVDTFYVRRIPLVPGKRDNAFVRIINMFQFSIGIAVYMLRHRYDIAMISTVPQIIGCMALRWSSYFSGSKYVYHCMDLHPEIAKCTGLIKDGFIYRFLLSIDIKNCEKASFVVVLSEDMKKTLQRRKVKNSENIVVINNFELNNYSNEPSLVDYKYLIKKNERKFRLLFAGNLGQFQNLDVLIDIAVSLRDNADIEFVFLGEGVMLNQLKEKSGDLLGKTIFFFGHQNVQITQNVIADADLCIVSLQENIYRYAYPSKTMSYLAEGAALLVIAECSSELSRTVKKAGIGYVVPPGDKDNLVETIKYVYTKRDELGLIRSKSKIFFKNIFCAENVLPKWSVLFQNIEKRITVER